MINYEYAKALLKDNKEVPYRKCTVCKEQMTFSTRQFHPVLVSCSCRGAGKSNIVEITWDDLKALLEKA